MKNKIALKILTSMLIIISFVSNTKALELMHDTTVTITAGEALWLGDNPNTWWYNENGPGKLTVYTYSGTFYYTHKYGGVNVTDTVHVHVVPATPGTGICQINILKDNQIIPDTLYFSSKTDTTITLIASNSDMDTYNWELVKSKQSNSMTNPDSLTANIVVHPKDTAIYVLHTTRSDVNEMVFNGDFELGNLGFESDFTYKPKTSANESPGNFGWGVYSIGVSSSGDPEYWCPCDFNGSGWSIDPPASSGHYFFGDGQQTAGGQMFYSVTFSVEPHVDYIVQAKFANLNSGATPPNQGTDYAIFRFFVNDTPISEYDTLTSPIGEWQNLYAIFNTGDDTLATMKIKNYGVSQNGNDFCLDDVSFLKYCQNNDTIVIINDLTIRNTINVSICDNETYTFGGEALSTAGVYYDTIKTSANIDSIVTLHLTVNPTPETQLSDTICEGTIYPFNGQQLVSSGDYTAHLQTESGCDSTVYLALIVNPISETHIDTTIFSWDNFYYNDTTISDDGTHRFTYQNIVGCDSLVTITIHYNKTVSQKADICAGEEYILGDRTLTTTGIYADTLLAQNGNDSIVLLSLTVHPSYYDTIEAKIGVGNVYNRYGFYESDSGTYVHSEQTLFGCDSITVLHLIVDEPLVIYTPNAITPGADNNNTFRVYTADENIVLESLRVYFRWGGLIFETDDIEQGWNGKYKNDFCEQGAYVYEVIYYRKDNPDKKYKKIGELMLIY